jgi:phage terminase large subunit
VSEEDKGLNKDFYKNLKAQGWWMLRRRFEKTFNCVTKNIESPFDELISIPSDLPNVHDIIDQLSQPTYKHDGSKKLIINKSPDGTKSPNEADAVMMCYWPVKTQEIFIA